MTTTLHQQRCSHQSGPSLDAATQQDLLTQVMGWQLGPDTLHKTFQTADYHRTMALVNAIAWIAHEQDHHPDLHVGYNRVTVHWSTHSVGGLSINDFICAARIEALWA
jgi:4a-hydroxytetrahydrobiopterin dehydratase